MVFGIGTLTGMFPKSFGFNWLTVCVAAAVSESKKAVSAAAAVVGIGLFLAPMDQAQGQHFDGDLGGVPVVKWVDISGCFDDDPSSYSISWDVNISDYWSDGVFIRRYFPSSCLYEGDYVYVKFSRAVWSSSLNRFVPSSSEWVELWVWMGSDDLEPYAYVYDSEGGRYETCFYIDEYHWSGPDYYSP